MNRSKIFFIIILILFLLEICVFSPEFNRNNLIEIIQNAFSFNYKVLDLSIICVFNSMGIVPVLVGCYLIPKSTEYRPSLLPFWLLTFAFGAGAILPYLIFRSKVSSSTDFKNEAIEKIYVFFRKKTVRFSLLIIMVLLVAFGFFAGSYEIYWEAFNSSKLIHVMTIDFIILNFIILPYLIFTESSN